MSEVPRLRMFAGPNGSGKTTIKSVIRSELLGVYVNPDEIEKEIAQDRVPGRGVRSDQKVIDSGKEGKVISLRSQAS